MPRPTPRALVVDEPRLSGCRNELSGSDSSLRGDCTGAATQSSSDQVASSKLGPAFAISFGVHTLALVIASVGARFSWPQPPIAIELKTPPPRKTTARPPAPPPPPPSTPSRAPRGKPGEGGHKPKAPEPPPPPPAPAASDLKDLAPAEANIVFYLRVERLAKSPYREPLERLLVLLPDYRALVVGSDTRLEDYIAVLVATSDPRDVAQTFLAVRFHDSERVRAIANRPLGGGDPRQFRFLKPGLGVLARPDDAAKLDAALSGKGGPTDGGEDPRRRWLAQLGELDQIGAKEGGPAILGTISDVQSLVRLGDGLPTPLAGAVALTLEASPAVRVRATFANEADAARMEAEWPRILARYRSLTAILGLASALDGLKIARRGAELELAGRLPAAQVKLALDLSRMLVPQAQQPAPAAPPPPAPPPPPTTTTESSPAPAAPAPIDVDGGAAR